MRSIVFAVAALLAGGLSPGGAAAQDIACGGSYTVVRGDTLQLITNRAYGPDKSYQLLYSANRATIGRDPGLIEIGMQLAIPCLDGGTVSAAPTATVTLEAQSTGAPPMPNRAALRAMTGTDWAPFTDHTQEQGGMITEILNVSLSRVMDEKDYKIDTIKDWTAHLVPLLSDVAYDVSIAWFKPNCDLIEKLGEDAQFRCRSLYWSDPLFEMITGYYVRADDPAKPRAHADLMGKRICRPEAYATYMLEEFDLKEPAITLVRPTLFRDCFEGLVAGEVDVILVATTVADSMAASLRLQGQIEEIPELAYVTTMHAVSSINNPRKEEQIALINEGLRQIREDGVWFEIVQRHLIAHAAKTTGG
ncbi:MAG: peptidoglycan-binding protein [Pikeienuella sp.]|uniref:peptidoglycan-binding protein n=1 Tax=Pikeienuella sp. TaxID=2831957 RepID=UPI00391C9285